MGRARLGDSASVRLARPWLAAAFASLAVVVVWCAPAGASGPRLTVAKADLAAAFKCPIDPTDATTAPLMFVKAEAPKVPAEPRVRVFRRATP